MNINDSDALTRNELLVAAAAKATAYASTADIAQIKSATDVNSESSRVATVFDQMTYYTCNS